MRPFSIAASMLILGVVLGLPASAPAEEHPGLEALVIEMATTPAQHQAVADHYRAEAAKSRTKAEQHRSMGRTYGGGKFATRQEMQKHCEELAAGYDAQARRYEELAKLHQREAGAD